MITIDDVRAAVIAALSLRFPGVPIYSEETEQGFQGPCFFVKILQVAQDKSLGSGYHRAHAFDVHYFAGATPDAEAVAEQVYDCLETIKVADGPCRGQGMRTEVVDGVLHCFVSYGFRVVRDRPQDPAMKDLEMEEGLK